MRAPAALACMLLLSASARAEDNTAKRVGEDLAPKVFGEVNDAAHALGSSKQSAPTPTWGAWAGQPSSPAARSITRLIDEWFIHPFFSAGQAQRVAAALGSGNANASAAAPSLPSEDAFTEKIMSLLGMGHADPLALGLAPDVIGKPVPPPKEKRRDSIALVRSRRR